jgi:HPt (histidine-containing phosphotransfer) domain-containing protein
MCLALEKRRPETRHRPIWVIITMPLPLQQVQWMPSPPLVPDDGPIDLAHLQRVTLGDASLEREVLAMFAAQAFDLIEQLVRMPADAAELAHKLKGSAQAVGAFRVTDAAEWLESTVRDHSDSAEALMTLTDAVLEVRSEIDGMLKRS